MINNNDSNDPKNILDMSKDISTKYQNLVESGNLNINDLLSGVFGLLNNPSIINEEFKDIDTSKLPDPEKLLGEINGDINIQNTLNSIKSDNNMGMFGSFMSTFMNNNKKQEDTLTINEIEQNIEKLMFEVEQIDKNNEIR